MDAAQMQSFSYGLGSPYMICPFSGQFLYRNPDGTIIKYNRFEDVPEGIRNFYSIPVKLEKRTERMPLIERDRNEFLKGDGHRLMFDLGKWTMRKNDIPVPHKWGGSFCQTISFDNYQDVPLEIRSDYEQYESREIARISGTKKHYEPEINEFDMSKNYSDIKRELGRNVPILKEIREKVLESVTTGYYSIVIFMNDYWNDEYDLKESDIEYVIDNSTETILDAIREYARRNNDKVSRVIKKYMKV